MISSLITSYLPLFSSSNLLSFHSLQSSLFSPFGSSHYLETLPPALYFCCPWFILQVPPRYSFLQETFTDLNYRCTFYVLMFNKCVLRAYYVSGTLLNSDKKINLPNRVYWGQRDNKQVNQWYYYRWKCPKCTKIKYTKCVLKYLPAI